MERGVERFILESPRLQDRLLNIKRASLRLKANIVGFGMQLMRRGASPVNVYHASVQKTGSQWIKAVLSDPDIRRMTGLHTYPQHRYEWNEFHASFPPYHFIPGLYISYGAFEEIRKPSRYAVFYVLRDPRDITVSWYFSMLHTHRLAGKVPQHRAVLRERSRSDGLMYAIDVLALKFAFMRDWLLRADRDRVLFVHFSELTESPVPTYRRILEHCGFAVSSDLLRAVTSRYTKETMAARERARPLLLKRRIADRSHYRHTGETWDDIADPCHRERLLSVAGDVVEMIETMLAGEGGSI